MNSNVPSMYWPIPITLSHEFCLAVAATVAPKSAQQMTFTVAPTRCKSPWSGPNGLDVLLQTHRACIRTRIVSLSAKCNFEISCVRKRWLRQVVRKLSQSLQKEYSRTVYIYTGTAVQVWRCSMSACRCFHEPRPTDSHKFITFNSWSPVIKTEGPVTHPCT
jgi:hypothetical protein